MIKYKTSAAFKTFAIENILEDESIFNWLKKKLNILNFGILIKYNFLKF
jgi:hypothetical protein